jgi:hypothetical protein
VQASISRAEWADFMNRFAPLEKQALDEVTNIDYTAVGNDAGQTAFDSMNRAQGTENRTLRSLGTKYTPEEQAALGRRRQLGMSQITAGTETAARAGTKESANDLLQGMLSIGRQSALQASEALGAAGSLSTAREGAYTSALSQYNAAKTANKQAIIGTGLMLAATFI